MASRLFMGSGFGRLAELRHRPHFCQETESIQHRPDFDALAVGKKVDLDSGCRDLLAGGSHAKEFAPMSTIEREAANHLLPFSDDVVDFNPHVGESLEETGVVVFQAGNTWPDTARKSVVNHRAVVHLQMSVQVPHFESKHGTLK